MDQSLALNALAPFLALAKSATSPRAAADLVTQATSAPNTYVFAELLQQPNIQALKDDEQFGSYFTLLRVFAWGTWEDYSTSQPLPSLSDAQALKLRLLSLLTLASEKTAPSSGSNLSYATLCRRLGLSSPIDLEHLITQAIYSNLITATLNPASQSVVITSVSPLRDLAPGSIGTMIAELEAWSSRCSGVLAELDAEIHRVKSDAARKVADETRTEHQVKAVMEASERAGGNGAGSRLTRNSSRRDDDDEFDDAMDVDGGGGGRRLGGGGGFGGFVGRMTGRSSGR